MQLPWAVILLNPCVFALSIAAKLCGKIGAGVTLVIGFACAINVKGVQLICLAYAVFRLRLGEPLEY